MTKFDLLELDVPKLFEERSIEDIIKIDKLLDAEIERKRADLRSMVGDRYKDILAATEAIKSMENLSEFIVNDIQNVKDRCESVVKNTYVEYPKITFTVNREKMEERTILAQIKLSMVFYEQIWLALDAEDFCKAAQFYLLNQHIHTGLGLVKRDVLEKYKVIDYLATCTLNMKDKILRSTNEKLQTVHLNIEDTCSNLNALMLLENYSGRELLDKFIDLRKNALKSIIEIQHPSVRAQISAMVKCLYTTIHLLHDCFLNYNNTKKGLIWHQLEEIIGPKSSPTLSKILLSESNLTQYIPDIIKNFRPNCNSVEYCLAKEESVKLIQKWVDDTSLRIKEGLESALELVPNVKGLHIIREEALKIEIPENWSDICAYTELQKNFNIWNFFFQNLITEHAQYLVTKKITKNLADLRQEITAVLKSTAEDDSESDLRWYVWQEENGQLNNHQKLGMKTKGFSPSVVGLCEVLDGKFLELLEDIFLYMYGKEYVKDEVAMRFVLDGDNRKKFVDREKLEGHLRTEACTNVHKLISYLEDFVNTNKEDKNFITKSILCARFFYGLTVLCPSLTKASCCSSPSEWEKLCSDLFTSSLHFWTNWIQDRNTKIRTLCEDRLNDLTPSSMLSMLCRWDSIEIQEQTDEKIFKSKIKVPMKISMALQEILDASCEMLNSVLPHTLPKQVHLDFIQRNTLIILKQYEVVLSKDLNQTQALQFLFDVKFLTTFCIPRENMELTQKSQDVCDKLRAFVDPFDLDVFYKYLQHNVKQNVLQSQVIFGSMLPSSGQLANLGLLEKNKEHEKEPSILAISTPSSNNWFSLLPVTAPVQKTAHTSLVEPVIFGSMLPSSGQLANLGLLEKNKEHEKEPSILAISTPSSNNWFSLLPVTAPVQKTAHTSLVEPVDNKPVKLKPTVKKSSESAGSVRSGAAALFGAMTTDWFS